MSEAEIRTQVSVLGLTGGLLLFTDNMKTLETDRLNMALGVLPTTPLRGRPISSMFEEGPPSAFGVGNLDDTGKVAVTAFINWKTRHSEISAPRDGFSFWTRSRVAKGEKVRLEAHDTLVLQCSENGAMLIGNTLHMTAIADGRISAVDDGERCTVSGTDELVQRTGLLVFDAEAEDMELISFSGVKVIKGMHELEGGAAAIEIEIEGPKWSLTVIDRAEKKL
jgi:hypothetical protein